MNNHSQFETISIRRQTQDIAEIELNRPQALNAINTTMAVELTAALEQLKDDKELKVLLLVGAGAKAFCVGADLKERSSIPQHERKRNHAAFEALASAAINFPIPSIAIVHGHCIGGGLELALMCDLIVADDAAQFAFPEVSLGIIPGMGGAFLLARKIGGGLAAEMVMTGKFITSRTAESHRIIDRVVATDKLKEISLELAHVIAKQPRTALLRAKQAVRCGFAASVEVALQRTTDLYHDCLMHPDSVDRLNDFVAAKFGQRLK